MSKGRDLLNKHNTDEYELPSIDVLGAPIAVNRQIEENDLTKSYLESTSKKELEINLEEEILENFNKLNAPTEEEILKDIQENFIGKQASDFYGDYKFNQKELDDYYESDESAPIRAICLSENYPSHFPDVKELIKLKFFFKEILAIQCGNFFEQYHFEIEPELFICRPLNSNDYFDFKQKFSDENNLALFYPYILQMCCLFPQIKAEDVFEMSAGSVKKLCENILINSKYKSTCTVTKL